MYHTLSKLREKRAKGDGGFTLIELLVVVVILGVLIAIAIPLYLNYRKGANDSAAQSDLKNAINTLEQCNADNSTIGYPGSVTNGVIFVTDCPNQKITLSSGTVLTYFARTGTPHPSYIMSDTNTNGTTTKDWCYDSNVGGAIKQTAAVTTTAGPC